MKQQLIADEGWHQMLKTEFSEKYFEQLTQKLYSERKLNTIYPPEVLQFNAFNKTPFDKVKIILLGQDPYHGPGQAHGLSFSVPIGTAIPRSLKNIFKELYADLNIPIPQHGNLEKWSTEGVLLLNTILTVREKTPKSHHGIGWEIFTDAIIRKLSNKKEHLVFMLWGNDAQTKRVLINENKHLVLTAAHPSPFSAARGFFGCRHFSKANDYLKKNNLDIVDWGL